MSSTKNEKEDPLKHSALFLPSSNSREVPQWKFVLAGEVELKTIGESKFIEAVRDVLF